ncbi:hypothetical protein PTKIN_Ptkin13bG0198800 [Pterospermum kingtungense]
MVSKSKGECYEITSFLISYPTQNLRRKSFTVDVKLSEFKAFIVTPFSFYLTKFSKDSSTNARTLSELRTRDSKKAGMVGLSVGEKHFIQGGIAQDLRSDGRKRLTYRPIYVQTGVIPQAHGSARVRLGATDVIASVKAELGKPSALQPDKGKIAIFIDCSPTAAPMFEGRGGEELSTELSVALQRCLLGGKSGAGAGIDPSSLVVVEGKVCWDLYIDGLVISSDGNLLDALAAAIKAALSNTGIPKVDVAAEPSGDEEPEVNISDEEFLQFDMSGVPVIVTLTKVGRHYIVDATSEEESQMSSAVSISVNRKGHICGLTKRGGAGLDPSIILDMISVVKHVSEQLINKLDSEIAAAEASEDES